MKGESAFTINLGTMPLELDFELKIRHLIIG